MLQAALLMLVFCAAAGQASAQCAMNCRGSSPGQPLTIFIDDQCEARLDTTILMDGPSLCAGDKILTVRDTLSNIIVSDTNQAVFDPTPYHGQLLRVIVEDLQSGLFCNSFVTLADTLPPLAECTADTISCLGDTSVIALGYPVISDNCSGDIALSYVDTITNYACGEPEVALIERTWRATDVFGNTGVCVQPVHILRPSLADIRFPADTTLSCENEYPDEAAAGLPTLLGDTIPVGNICSLEVEYEDYTIPNCSGLVYDILRTWTVRDTCSGQTATEIQLVSVVDTVAPQITCPAAVTATTLPTSCYARVTLPLPVYEDNCDEDATFFVSTSFGGVGLGPHNFVPVGTHILQYTSIDACQNTRTCTTTLTVVDAEPPTASCNQSAAISIPGGGYGIAPAAVFNEGSNDNCANTLYYKVRRAEPGACNMANGDDAGLPGYQEWLDDEAIFCCEDAGEPVLAVLHVYDKDPGDGPVDPTRELPGGDLHGRFSECQALIQVRDVLNPVLTCPSDTVIDCSTDYSDLTAFGNPMFSDNCSGLVGVQEETDISDCGTGTITRTFRAADPAGNVAACTQQISVVNLAPLSEGNIIWPADYTTGICGAQTDPDDLPNGYNRPQVAGLSCTNTAISYEDDLFNIAPPACYKILRRWTVIDWCAYDPEYPQNGGRFTRVQVIKVEDNDAPVLDCPASVTKGVSNDCSYARVDLSPATALDCNTSVIITNDSPYAFSGGANASGDYPPGTTVVSFSAADRCGNLSTCEVSVNVVDNRAPAPICIVGLSVNLSGANGDGTAVVSAAAFDGGSTDNCTDRAGLRRTIRRVGTGIPGVPPASTELSFTCADRGNQMVEFWVTDGIGNSDYCVTVVAVQDNNGICPQQASGVIAGGIQTERGEYVDNVMIRDNFNSMETSTGDLGFFELLNVPYGGDYTISAHRDDALLNGVSTFDLVLVSKHILGIQRLDSPYKQIAADVNKSGEISTLDMIGLRKMILGLENRFPNGNTSWRFVDARYVFPDPDDAFAAPFPEIININNFTRDEMEADFVAIKVGDVDHSAVANSLLGAEGRGAAGELALHLPARSARAGELITLPFTAARMDKISAYQFSLGFATESLELVSLQTSGLPGMSEGNFNLQAAGEGRISTSWNWPSAEAEDARGNTLLFSLVFRARKDIAQLDPLFYIGNDPTPAEAYDADGRPLSVRLHFEEQAGAVQGTLELYQNHPNPFHAETLIGFRLPVSGAARLSIFDLSGKMLYRREGYFESGYNEIVLSAAGLPSGGVLYYQLETAGQTVAKKMIVLR